MSEARRRGRAKGEDMAMKFYGLKACDTCRKAEKSLKNRGIDFVAVDVRADGIPEAELRRFIDAFDADVINRRSTTWRNLTVEEREKEAIVLLIEHPTLMKRPVIDDNGTLYLGWGKDVQNALLGD